MALIDIKSTTFDDAELDHHIQRALAVERPRGLYMEASYQLIKRVFHPQLLGLDNLPEGPALFIGNHSLFAFDGAILVPVMWHATRRFLRGLGDRFLWHPLSEEMLLGQGAVLGHPRVCGALMEQGADLMVFPGGAFEMAIQHEYPIVPMAIVGPDEFFDHLIEGRDLPDTAAWRLLERLGLVDEDTRRDLLPPLPVGALGSLLPKPQRCYIQFGETVRPRAPRGRAPGKQTLKRYRDDIGGQIEAMLEGLQSLRDEDRNQQGFVRRLLTR